MTDQRSASLKKACFEAYQRVNHEAIAFVAARLYLLQINVAALEKIEPIKTAHDAFESKLKPTYASPYHFFMERAYISLVASFELFLQDVLTAVVIANPKKVGQVEFKLSEILDAHEKEELIGRAIEATMNKLMYKRPLEYLGEIASLLSIDQTPLLPYWPMFVEAKARRDLGVHNGWRCNAIYIRKVIEAGFTPTIALGDSAFPSEDEYLDSVSATLDKLANIVMTAIAEKHLKSI